MADADVASLAERMAEALKNEQIEKSVYRFRVYWAAGIHRNDYPVNVWLDADEIAYAQELSRRLTQ